MSVTSRPLRSRRQGNSMDAPVAEDGEGAQGGNGDPPKNEPLDPPEVDSWVKGRILGTGGFGTVTLWKQKTTGQVIGES